MEVNFIGDIKSRISAVLLGSGMISLGLYAGLASPLGTGVTVGGVFSLLLAVS